MNSNTLLYRQIKTGWFKSGDDDTITSLAFLPKKDQRLHISVDDGDMISAEESWLHHTAKPNVKSLGVKAVTVAECNDQSLRACHDLPNSKEHVSINFEGLSNGKRAQKGKNLADDANRRGWCFRPS